MSAPAGIQGPSATGPRAGRPHLPPGTAGRIAAALGDDLTIADMYDDLGGPLYHLLARDDRSEISEVVSLLRGTDGPILELACGSGRLTLPLLLAGHHVTGVDLSESLLRELSTQVERLPAHRAADRLTTVHGDMLTLSLGTRFAAALLGITTIGLVPPRKRPDFLRTIHSHLLPGGRFLVSVNVPPHGPGEEDITTTVVRDAVLTVISRIEPNGAGRHVSMLRIGRGTTPLLATSFVHLVTPEQLSDELVAAGFEMESVRPVANSLNRPADGCALLVARRPS